MSKTEPNRCLESPEPSFGACPARMFCCQPCRHHPNYNQSTNQMKGNPMSARNVKTRLLPKAQWPITLALLFSLLVGPPFVLVVLLVYFYEFFLFVMIFRCFSPMIDSPCGPAFIHIFCSRSTHRRKQTKQNKKLFLCLSLRCPTQAVVSAQQQTSPRTCRESQNRAPQRDRVWHPYLGQAS